MKNPLPRLIAAAALALLLPLAACNKTGEDPAKQCYTFPSANQVVITGSIRVDQDLTNREFTIPSCPIHIIGQVAYGALINGAPMDKMYTKRADYDPETGIYRLSMPAKKGTDIIMIVSPFPGVMKFYDGVYDIMWLSKKFSIRASDTTVYPKDLYYYSNYYESYDIIH